jgi:hypothetical protein
METTFLFDIGYAKMREIVLIKKLTQLKSPRIGSVFQCLYRLNAA